METRAAISGTEPTEADESSTNRPCHRSFRGPLIMGERGGLILVGRGLVNGSGACLAVEAEPDESSPCRLFHISFKAMFASEWAGLI